MPRYSPRDRANRIANDLSLSTWLGQNDLDRLMSRIIAEVTLAETELEEQHRREREQERARNWSATDAWE